ncbi:TetR/AcrR family transcriptional regulator [Amycolatopsis sp. PS_44_ISF1]|uniref:TetR/AcrR family transcriptional regulator n=1 Tax=Amycolatopsis sp. PS_44_ISF1 TaxID=2974917 RepID=UPI0028E0899B|nr:TetR/AcrR family transcriptional regulator [Amycolatopsis sp. PS_44_ISF1]MDT8913435.1 TetR/AcrR family transcriptional regulator [Amycolatopsis sp. PS_44_ISF1]
MVTAKPGGPGRRRSAPTKGDRREQAILDAAEALLEHEREEPMTVETIAKGAGISRASLYFYFGSKHEVLAALVARTVAVLREDALGAADDTASSPAATVTEAVRRTAKQWSEHGPVMRAAVDFSATVPEIDELWQGTLASYAEAMTRVLVRGGVPGDQGPAGAAAVARGLCWMTERMFYWASARPIELRAATETCTQIWLRVLESA